jgi:hypothetical protein
MRATSVGTKGVQFIAAAVPFPETEKDLATVYGAEFLFNSPHL